MTLEQLAAAIAALNEDEAAELDRLLARSGEHQTARGDERPRESNESSAVRNA